MMSLLMTGIAIGIVYAVNPDTNKVIFPGWENIVLILIQDICKQEQDQDN
ncbi:unnamed protein product [Paramecium primaurelia]|uniref:TMhelix containing protein n=1 Tax=Paramecium primaurelia TaxID=5886 RepID=A0A8S1PEF6_PARPR|nr:unnamed protein product [Paramecium primaurelia]